MDVSFWERTTTDPVAAFTGILALFTIVLSAVSIIQIRFLTRADKAAQVTALAASQSAKAAIGSQLPLISLAQLNLLKMDNATDRGSPINPDTSLPVLSRLLVKFTNGGRTPAEAITLFVEWCISDKLPEMPMYEHSYPYAPGIFIPAENRLHNLELQNYLIQLSPIQILETNEGIQGTLQKAAYLWIYGKFVYRDVIVGDTHEYGFCAKWNAFRESAQAPVGFVYDSETPPKYIFRT